MDIKERVRKAIDDSLSSRDLVEIWNEYSNKMGYYEDRYYEMELFNDQCNGMTPLEIAEMLYKADFNPSHKYFKDNMWGITSFENDSDCDIELDDVIDYIVDNDEDFGDSRIREILDSADEDDDTIILIHPTYGEDIAIGKEEFRNEHDNEADMFFTESNEVMTGHEIVEWIDEHGGDELVITEFTLEKYLRRNGFTTEMCVCLHDGIVFGDDTCFDDGRFYQWFYCPTNGLLLKLYFASPSCSDLVLYIKEIKGNESQMDMYRLIQRYVH